jgi:HAMP domain-containing protein
MNLQKKLLITYLFIALVPLFLVALMSYNNMYDALFSAQRRAVEAEADMKTSMIKDYFEGFREEMTVVKDRFVVRTDLPVISRFASDTASAEYKAARAPLSVQMETLVKGRPEINSVIFTNREGMVVYSTDRRFEMQPIGKAIPFFGDAAFNNGRGGVYFTDIYEDRRDDNLDYLISAPVYGFNNVFEGIIMLEVDSARLLSMVGAEKGLGNTGETLFVRRVSGPVGAAEQTYAYDEKGGYVLFLNPLLFDPEASFGRVARIGDPDSQPAQEAAQGRDGLGFSIDYRGKEVLAAWRYLPENHLGLVTKIDMEELLLPVKTVARAILVFGVVAALVIAFFSWILSRTISSPIIELTRIAKKIGEGDMNIEFGKGLTSTTGEVGVLASVLSASIASLRDLYKNLEGKVKERTEKLEESQGELKKTLEKTERLNKLMVGRELKMVEMKERMEKMEKDLPEKK